MKNIKIFLADDHQIFREGLKMILSTNPELEVIGEAGDGKIALENIEQLKPDMVVLDISMPSMSGIEIARHLKKYNPGIRIIMLSRHDNIQYINEVLKYGVNGYVLKDEASDDLKKAIEVISKGDTYLSPRATKHLVKDHFSLPKQDSEGEDENPFFVLTHREREVLKLIAEAKSTKDIASKLWISPKTVKAHRANIMKKLDIHNVVELVRFAVKNGLVDT